MLNRQGGLGQEKQMVSSHAFQSPSRPPKPDILQHKAENPTFPLPGSQNTAIKYITPLGGGRWHIN